ncbi:Flagellar basal-body rod modification protein FlgD [hydrothermal vent metagenome]|uniref:Flagellar basal-body rod modification protein FlgD n=1 Tax=hydrothermal vent metagenome TaxID=652676 RepID=A0A3B0XAU8_9ZZZZ
MTDISVENNFTSINPAVNNAVLDKPNELTQANFIELLVAQVKNQDPTKPMDPSQFMNQLTQSSMVNGLNDLQNSFDTLATKLSSDQSLQAAGLVGKSALLSGGETLLSAGSSVSGQINLEEAASDVTINVFNSRGEQIRSLPLGANSAGNMLFKWDGFADDGSIAPQGNYLVTAEVSVNGNQQAAEVFLESRIDSISINQSIDGSPSGTLLNLASGQSVSLNDVKQIK